MKIKAFFVIVLFSLFSSISAFAELKTIDAVIRWYDTNFADVSGYNLYCGKVKGGPYSGIDITGGNPLDIPVGNVGVLDADNHYYYYQFSITLDTATERNVFCVIKSYDENGAESGASSEASFVNKIIETVPTSTSLTIEGVREKKVDAVDYDTAISVSKSYSFDEPVIIREGKFKQTQYKEFVVIGKNTHTVWVIPTSEFSATGFSNKEIWLTGSDVNMDNVDDLLVLNFDGEDGPNKFKDDIAIIDYTSDDGSLKVFLNTGSAFGITPVSDSGYGTFSGKGVFRKSISGDFTNNGYDDLALYAPSTRNVVVWESNGTTFINRSIWCQGGSVDALPQAIDYNGDDYVDIMFFNFVGGAFSAFASNGNKFNFETVKHFSAGAFDYALVGEFDIFNRGNEFGIHAKGTTGNFVVFKYDPVNSDDPDPFKSEKIWVNTTKKLY